MTLLGKLQSDQKMFWKQNGMHTPSNKLWLVSRWTWMAPFPSTDFSTPAGRNHTVAQKPCLKFPLKKMLDGQNPAAVKTSHLRSQRLQAKSNSSGAAALRLPSSLRSASIWFTSNNDWHYIWHINWLQLSARSMDGCR